MTTRRLAAILAADVVGFSSMMERDEEGTLERVKALQREVIEPRVKERGGRLVKTTGDGFLMEFGSPVEAVRCALEVQHATKAKGGSDLLLRMGINLGDIIVEPDGDIYGDGVNVAARLEQLAEPGGICVSASVHEHAEGKVPVAFESRGEQSVKNIARPIQIYALAGAAQQESEPKRFALPDKPSIAVLPFTNMSGDPEQEYFADGVVEEILTALARFRWLLVIARNSSFVYRGRGTDVRQVGKDLGVHYILEGSVRRHGERIRITGQLVAADSGAHVWADRYDRSINDLFAVQDEITERVVTAIDPAIRTSEVRRRGRKLPESMDAWDHYLKGSALFFEYKRDVMPKARSHFEEAIRLAPDFALAYARLAETHGQETWFNWTATPKEAVEACFSWSKKAAALDEYEAAAFFPLAMSLLWMGQHEAALDAADRAVDLNCNYHDAHFARGVVRSYCGFAAEGIASFKTALRLSPTDPHAWSSLGLLSMAYYLADDYESAIITADKALRFRPRHFASRVVKTAALAQLGSLEAAQECLRASPDISEARLAQQWPFRKRDDLERLLKGLRKAGLRE